MPTIPVSLSLGAGTKVTKCTVDEIDIEYYLNNPIITSRPKINLPWIVFGLFDNNRRKRNEVHSLYTLALDIDDEDYSEEDVIAAINNFGYDAYYFSTYSAWQGNGTDIGVGKWRIIFLLHTPWIREDTKTEDWAIYYERVRNTFPLNTDSAPKDPSRFWFGPAHRKGQDYKSDYIAGPLLDIHVLSDTAKTNGQTSSSKSQLKMFQDLIAGVHFHDYLIDISWHKAQTGVNIDDNYLHCYGLMQRSDAKHKTHPEHQHWLKTIDELMSIINGAYVKLKEPPTEIIGPFNDVPYDLTDSPIPEIILENWLMRETVTLLVAEGGTGKSTLANQIAISLVLGEDLVFNDPYIKKHKVLIINGEDPISQITRRFAGILKDRGITDKQSIYDSLKIYPQLSQRDKIRFIDKSAKHTVWKDRLIEYINRTNIDVLVIDPMGKFHNAEENSNDDMSKFMEVLNEIAETCCIAILLVHHTRKPKEGDEATYRGASTIKDSCRLLYKMRLMNSGDSAAIHVDKEDYWKYVVLECEKSNYFRQSGITILTRQTVELNNVNNFERPSLNETYILIPISNDEIKENNSDPGDDNRMLEALANSMIDSNVQSVTVTKAGQILHEQMPNKGAQRLRKMFKDILPMGSKKKIITHKGDMFLYHQESKNGRSAGIKFVKD